MKEVGNKWECPKEGCDWWIAWDYPDHANVLLAIIEHVLEKHT